MLEQIQCLEGHVCKTKTIEIITYIFSNICYCCHQFSCSLTALVALTCFGPDINHHIQHLLFESTCRCFETQAISLFHSLCLGRDTNSCWSLLTGIYARGSKISHTWKKPLTSQPHNLLRSGSKRHASLVQAYIVAT